MRRSERAPLRWDRFSAVAPVLAATLLTCGCSDDDPEKTEPTVDIEQLPRGWNKIEPGGRTMCARGTPWEFYVRPGNVNKVVVEYEGGGACWDFFSCLEGANIFVDFLRIPPEMEDEGVARGTLDTPTPETPSRTGTTCTSPASTALASVAAGSRCSAPGADDRRGSSGRALGAAFAGATRSTR